MGKGIALLLFSLVGLFDCSFASSSQRDRILPRAPSLQPRYAQQLARRNAELQGLKFGALVAAPPSTGSEIPKAQRPWTVTCDSEAADHACGLAIDTDNTTYWQSESGIGSHGITVDLGSLEYVTSISMKPVDGATSGMVAAHTISLSLDGQTWGAPVAYGTWYANNEVKYANIQPQQAQYVRITSISATGGADFVAIAEVNVWSDDNYSAPAGGGGSWGVTIDFPTVPVGVFVDPHSGQVVAFSSRDHDSFDNGNVINQTLTAVWDPAAQTVSERMVTETSHDMFCPGMAFDVNGRMYITGGDTSQGTSIYDSSSGGDAWQAGAPMNIGRGYQGSATTADGRIFVIGGSFSPPVNGPQPGNKVSEIIDPRGGNWVLQNGIPGEDIQTFDWKGPYRSDNHVWLMAWKNNTLYQPGPSLQMHWINVDGDGAISQSIQRRAGGIEENDAMCGIAVMYDAIAGKILTAGGAISYDYYQNDDGTGAVVGGPATTNSFVITLDQPNGDVEIEVAGSGMNFQRIYHSATVMPNGEVFVSGGMVNGQPFLESTAQLSTEIYSPESNSWRQAAPHATIRVYHSFGILLADATILVGGGGLCGGGCSVNHFDAQVYTPQYLLNSDGSLAARPLILSTSAPSVSPGGTLSFTTNGPIESASLMRYGGATHGINNDQRRMPLTLSDSGTNSYSFTLPTDGGVATPGYWMLFAMNSQGVPSVSANVQILVA